jgi:predicted nucleic-acid-binding Zn-ribbon protein
MVDHPRRAEMNGKEIQTNVWRFAHGLAHWELEKFRTFHCMKCGPFVVAENDLRTEGSEHAGYFLAGPLTKSEPVCPKCGAQNYELASFMARYGLIRKPKAVKAKAPDDPIFTFEGGIDCTGRKHDRA